MSSYVFLFSQNYYRSLLPCPALCGGDSPLLRPLALSVLSKYDSNNVLKVPYCKKAAVTRPGAYEHKATSGSRWPLPIQDSWICLSPPTHQQVDNDDDDDDVCDHRSHLDSLRREQKPTGGYSLLISDIQAILT